MILSFCGFSFWIFLGASSTEYGIVFSLYELMILTTAPVFGKMVSKISSLTICKFGLVICGLSTIVFGLIDRAPAGVTFITLAYAIRIVEGISASAFMTASYALMASKFPDNIATIFSFLEAAFGVGLILGPTLGGSLYELGGFEYPFFALGTCLFLGFFVLQIFMNPTKPITPGNDSEGNMTEFLCDQNIIFDIVTIITSMNFIGFNSATLEPHLRQFEYVIALWRV